ncbi:MAG TPA: CO dehydrogenase/CO-methylating acetyl-CoA synthase complex subunit beta [Methanomicrobiales archaeon]|nr:CO dehydrogenase/CO-methylating acetyl-CoA synthase complex subunit beta [Methanomicrobiales archaeon]
MSAGTGAGEGMFADIPVDVGVVYEGERVRKQQMHAEFGGPNIGEKYEILEVKAPGEVEDGRIEVIGPDLPGIPEGASLPFGTEIAVSGKGVEPDMAGVMERRIHDFSNWIEGYMHLNQRDAIWLRVDKRSVKKGLTLRHVGTVLARLLKSAIPLIEAVSVTFITDPAEVSRRIGRARAIFEERDARTRGMTDDDVGVFFGCTLCQSFAPSHVCVITPQRYANCGAISWMDGRAASRVDPKGPIFEIEKGECVDPVTGEYTGVNAVVKEKSLGSVERVQLYSAFGYPHTSCGCFECTTFSVPECDALGIVHREFRGTTPTGLSFGAIADSTAGGRQVDGFHGLSFEYMRSPRFLAASGGWNRIVWLPSELKERMKGIIPAELYDAIATEKDVSTVGELLGFLKEHHHPAAARVKAAEAAAAPASDNPGKEESRPVVSAGQNTVTIPGGSVSLTLKNVKIHAERMILRKKQE